MQGLHVKLLMLNFLKSKINSSNDTLRVATKVCVTKSIIMRPCCSVQGDYNQTYQHVCGNQMKYKENLMRTRSGVYPALNGPVQLGLIGKNTHMVICYFKY